MLPHKGNICHPFSLKPAHHNVSRPSGLWALLSIWPARRVTNESVILGGLSVNRQAPGGSPVSRQLPPGHTEGYIPDISPQFNLDLSMLNWSCKINTRKKFDRLCSGLKILVIRHLIILKSLSFPSSGKSGSIGQPHNQFADIGFSQKNIVKNNSFESTFNALTWQKYWSWNIQLIFSRLEDVVLAGLSLPKLRVLSILMALGHNCC